MVNYFLKHNYQGKVVHCKKMLSIFQSPAGMSLIKLSLAGNYKVIPARKSLVCGIPAGDMKIDKLFLQCNHNNLELKM